MGLYTEPSMELLCQQIVRDNPGLAGKITADSIGVRGVPVAKNVNGRNTQITLVGKPGKGFAGEITVYYDRLNLASLFKSGPKMVSIPRSAQTHAEALPAFNELNGLNLTASDITSPNVALMKYATPETVTLTAHVNSLCYTGSCKMTYVYEPIAMYPKSGPGPKGLMAGNELYGFFGLVSAEELFTSDEMVYALYNGTNWPNRYAIKWLKFFLNGAVVFVPTRAICNVTWADLYNKGAIFDSGDAGPRPKSTYTPVDVEQLKYMVKRDDEGTHYFRMSIPYYTENAAAPDWSKPPSITSILSLTSKLGSVNVYGEWGTLSTTDANFLDYVWLRHQFGADQAYYQSISASYRSNTYIYTSSGFWPILEMFDVANEPVPLIDEGAELTWAPSVVTLTDIDQNESLRVVPITETSAAANPRPLVFNTDNTETATPAWVRETSSDSPRPLLATTDNDERAYSVAVTGMASVKIRPIILTTDQIAQPSKITLGDTNGELDGFQ